MIFSSSVCSARPSASRSPLGVMQFTKYRGTSTRRTTPQCQRSPGNPPRFSRLGPSNRCEWPAHYSWSEQVSIRDLEVRAPHANSTGPRSSTAGGCELGRVKSRLTSCRGTGRAATEPTCSTGDSRESARSPAVESARPSRSRRRHARCRGCLDPRRRREADEPSRRGHAKRPGGAA